MVQTRVKIRPWWAAVILGIVALVAPVTAGADSIRQTWYGTWQLGEQAREARKTPAIVYLYTPAAIGSKRMEEETLPDARVQALLPEFVKVAINGFAQPDVARDLRVITAPTFVFLDAKGQELDRASGFKDVETFLSYLNNVLAYHRGETTGPYQVRGGDILEARPNTRPLLMRIQSNIPKTVHLVGEFNDWRTDATPLVRGEGDVWAVTLHLPDGVYEYMYLMDGSEYRPDPRNPLRKPNPYGGMNSVLMVGPPRGSPTLDGRRATFIAYHSEASDVSVSGSFSNWEPMKLFPNPNDPGMWGVSLNLPPGTYSYKYIIDGEWMLDPLNYTPITEPDGNMNSGFVVY